MHTFQPYPINSVEFNPFAQIGQCWAMITVGNKLQANCTTVSWGGVGVMWSKNVAFLFLQDSRYTKELIDENEFLSISFLSEQYKNAMKYCGSASGRNEDKFKNAGFTLAFRHSIPYIDEGNCVLLCKKLSATPISHESLLDPSLKEKWYSNGDYHTMYIVEIIEAMAR